MSIFGKRDTARDILGHAVTELLGCRREGITSVAVDDVLTLLGAPIEGVPAPAQQAPPGTDPLTGCRGVLPG